MFKITERFIGHACQFPWQDRVALHPDQSIHYVFHHGELMDFCWLFPAAEDE